VWCGCLEGMAERNANTPKDRRLEFRIGINLGDVIIQDEDEFGDGVTATYAVKNTGGQEEHRGHRGHGLEEPLQTPPYDPYDPYAFGPPLSNPLKIHLRLG
jgi:hypothetical protein